MQLVHFLRKESQASFRRLAFMAVVSGLATVVIMAVINLGVSHAVADSHSFRHLLMFLVGVGLYVVSQRYLMVETMTEVERILDRLRLRITDTIRSSDLEPLERIGRSEINTCLSRETQTISQGSVMLVNGLQAAVLLFFAIFYLLWISVIVFAVFVIVTVIAAMVYQRQSKRLSEAMVRAMERENKLLDTVSHVLDGFAEIKMNPQRSDALFAHLCAVADSALVLRIDTQSHLAKLFIGGQTIFYGMIAAMVFVVPQLSDPYNDVVVQATTAMLFLTGPISSLITSFPALANSNAAIENLTTMEAQLVAAVRRQGGQPDAQIAPFKSLHCQDLVFQYHCPDADRPFTLGPLELTLTTGETVFIVGGNGSGKSTFLRLLTGLYEPDQGLIRINGEVISDSNLQAYRNLFSVIFSDFHLFDRLYGLEDRPEERVNGLLAEMELTNKTTYQDGEFSTLDLSTGQRKRLAYIVSLLEDRPIYIFDEWAAGQDPDFRRKFYEKLLPQLKQQGKTIIAVTHDDRYWQHADRVLKMEEGRFIQP